MNVSRPSRWKSLLADYSTVVVLLVLCVIISALTWAEQHPNDPPAARKLAAYIAQQAPASRVLIVARDTDEDRLFAAELAKSLPAAGVQVVGEVHGDPAVARAALDTLVKRGEKVDVIAGNNVSAGWGVFENLGDKYPTLADTIVARPTSYWWPNFLKTGNLLNVANQIAVFAVIGIGMTMVIITGGIDLSVGSLVAISAVVAARLIRDYGGAEQAGVVATLACSLAAIVACGGCGLFSGLMVTRFRVPPFIATLSMMLMASGTAYILANEQTINQLPEGFDRLGRGADLFGLPNAVLLTLVLYVAAHLFLTRTMLGRYIYAVGGNRQAAWLSGIPVERVLLFVYVACGMLAGLGGVMLASLLESGSPNYGPKYELYVIAATVVGGTSLNGGEGRIFNTLVGALIIAVIQNGMNLLGVTTHMQDIVLGGVILAAVVLDNWKRGGS